MPAARVELCSAPTLVKFPESEGTRGAGLGNDRFRRFGQGSRNRCGDDCGARFVPPPSVSFGGRLCPDVRTASTEECEGDPHPSLVLL